MGESLASPITEGLLSQDLFSLLCWKTSRDYAPGSTRDLSGLSSHCWGQYFLVLSGFSTILQWETEIAVNSRDPSYLNKSIRQTGCYPTLDVLYSHTTLYSTFMGTAEAGEETWNHQNYSCVDNEKSLQMVGWINNLCEQPFFSSNGYAKCSAGCIFASLLNVVL